MHVIATAVAASKRSPSPLDSASRRGTQAVNGDRL